MKKVPQTECQRLYHYTNSAAEFCNVMGNWLKSTLIPIMVLFFPKFCNNCETSLCPVASPACLTMTSLLMHMCLYFVHFGLTPRCPNPGRPLFPLRDLLAQYVAVLRQPYKALQNLQIYGN